MESEFGIEGEIRGSACAVGVPLGRVAEFDSSSLGANLGTAKACLVEARHKASRKARGTFMIYCRRYP